MRLRILGKYWNIKFLPNLHNNFGTCDSPCTKNKCINIQAGLDQKTELDTCIHEILHSANFKTYSEDYVTELATDLATALWRLGWRKEK